MQGFYASDTRLISQLALAINGKPVFALAHTSDDESVDELGYVGDPSRPFLLVKRSLTIHDGHLSMSLDMTNLEQESASVSIDLKVLSDFADIFDVKRGDLPRGGFVGSGPSDGDLVLAYENHGSRRGLRVTTQGAREILRDGVHVQRSVEPRESINVTFSFVPESARYQPLGTTSAPREVFHFSSALDVTSDYFKVIATSCRDIESLLMQDPTTGETVIAAGSPWFLTLFGRDSLIVSMQVMAHNTELGLNVLRALALRQGKQFVAQTAEEPGRILHEVRTGEAAIRPSGWGDIYYGTVDATPLFIMTMAAALQEGADPQTLRALMPAAESAYQWITSVGDLDGDGFIEYSGKTTGTGLDNQGWKDSYDAVRHADGQLAQGPIALVEVQGYKYAALLGLADLREQLDSGDGESLRREAKRLRHQIHEKYWLDDLNCFALALDGNKRAVQSVTSNAGHLLWTHTAFDDVALSLGQRLMQDDVFTGFGLCTLANSHPSWNPLSYHCGSVWPHDTAIVAAGMLGYPQLQDLGHALAKGLFDAAHLLDGHLPELFAGFPRSQYPTPVPYPSSCRPQAWAAGAALMLSQR